MKSKRMVKMDNINPQVDLYYSISENQSYLKKSYIFYFLNIIGF